MKQTSAIILLFATLVSSSTLFAGWTQTNGPTGGDAVAFTSLGGTIFIGGSGVFRSTDDGVTWSLSGTRLTHLSVTCLDTLDGDLFAGTSDSGVFRSTDSGTTWTPMNNGISVDVLNSINAFCVLDGNLLIATYDQGVLSSNDHGASWHVMNNGIPHGFYGGTDFGAIVSTDGMLYVSMDTGLTGSRGRTLILRSSNQGETWSQAYSGSWEASAALAASGRDVYAIIFNSSSQLELIHSSDSGSSWDTLNSPEPQNEIYDVSISNGILCEGIETSDGTGTSLYSSTDRGATWTRLPDLQNTGVYAVAPGGSSLFAYGSPLLNAGIYRSHDNGASWSKSNAGFIATTVPDLMSDGQELYAAAYTIFHSSDGGQSWSDAGQGEPVNDYVTAMASHDGFLFAGYNYNGVYLSSDRGAHWNHSDTEEEPTAFAFMGSKWFYSTVTSVKVISSIYTYYAGIYESLDSGVTWHSIGPFDTASGVVYELPISTITTLGDTLLAGSDEGLFRTTDDGVNWQLDTTHAEIDAFAQSGNVLYAGATGPTDVVGALQGVKGVLRSTDNGLTWNSTPGMKDSVVYKILAYGNGLFAMTTFGLYYSTDQGNTWTSAGTPDPLESINSVIIANGNLVVGFGSSAGSQSGRGVWERPLSDFGITSSVAEKPVSGSEMCVYPNPLSQSTTISFSSQASGYAEVSIVNAVGTEVAKLYSGELSAGAHSFTWDADGTSAPRVSNGMYECLVRMNGQVQSAGMIVLR